MFAVDSIFGLHFYRNMLVGVAARSLAHVVVNLDSLLISSVTSKLSDRVRDGSTCDDLNVLVKAESLW